MDLVLVGFLCYFINNVLDSACVLKNVIKGVHLFMAKVAFDGVLVHFITLGLLVFNCSSYVSNLKENPLLVMIKAGW